MGTNTLSSFQEPSKEPTKPDDCFGLADALFSSTQRRLLALLFGHPERSFYARELIALTGSGSGAVQRELTRLAQHRLLTMSYVGNQTHYQANPHSPIFQELQSIVVKTFGIADQVRQALLPLQSKITCALLYGSVAKGETHVASDVDLMVISDSLTLGDLFALLGPIESKLGRKVSPTLYTKEEFSRRRTTNNPFLTKVLAGKLIPIIGDINAAS